MSIFLQTKESRKVRGEGILIKRIHNAKVPQGDRLEVKGGEPKSHPNGWLFWYYKDLKDFRDFKVVKDYSSLVQLVLSIRKYER